MDSIAAGVGIVCGREVGPVIVAKPLASLVAFKKLVETQVFKELASTRDHPSQSVKVEYTKTSSVVVKIGVGAEINRSLPTFPEIELR